MTSKTVPLRTRYREIADRLEQAIRTGAHLPGSRMPSVRDLCRTWTASITTVTAAYDLLERRGLVETRPQSGHFALRPRGAPEPDVQRTRLVPTDVTLGQLALMVMKDSLDPRLVPFGPGLPDPELLPVAELQRIVARLGRAGEAPLATYGVPPGLESLRIAIARHGAGFGCAISPEEVVVTAGALEALTLALRATCRAGQTVAIESPLYYGLLQSIEALGLRVIEIPTDPRHGLSLAALREALDEHPVAAVVAMPTGSNPLGCRAGDEATRELVELLAGRGIPLIEDDAWGDLALDGSRPRPAKAFDRAGLVLWCSSLSKTVTPGLRIGWIAAGCFQAAVEHLLFTNAIGPSPLSQAVAAAYFHDGGLPRCLRRARDMYAMRTTAMADAVIEAFPTGTRVGRPQVGFCLWVELPEGLDGQAVYDAALRLGISITPGRLFSAKLRYRHFIRLCAAQWSESLRPDVRRLGKAITKLRQISTS